MNLEELKTALDSEGRQKAEKLESDNNHLKTVIRKKNERIAQLENSLRVMYNRCYATAGMRTGGTMCFMCGERRNCDRLRSVGKGTKSEEMKNGEIDK